MEREQRHKETEAKLQNLHDENRARAEKLNWVHELAEVADKEAELDAELEPEAERDTGEALAVENINRTKFHSQRYERKEMLSTSELARREWKKGWRHCELVAHPKQLAGKLHLLAHLETAHSWDDGIGEHVVHRPFYGWLHVVAARGLKSADVYDKNPGSDPYVEVRWNNQLLGRTRVFEDDCNPKFDEKFMVRVCPTQHNTLSLEVFDHDDDAFDDEPDFLGELVRAGQGRCMLPTVPTEFELQKKPGRDRVIHLLSGDVYDTFNDAVGGYLTMWFSGSPGEEAVGSPAPVVPTGGSKKVLQQGTFTYRRDPVDLSFAEIGTFEDVARVSTERAYAPWSEELMHPPVRHIPTPEPEPEPALAPFKAGEAFLDEYSNPKQARAAFRQQLELRVGAQKAEFRQTYGDRKEPWEKPSTGFCERCRLVPAVPLEEDDSRANPSSKLQELLRRPAEERLCEFCLVGRHSRPIGGGSRRGSSGNSSGASNVSRGTCSSAQAAGAELVKAGRRQGSPVKLPRHGGASSPTPSRVPCRAPWNGPNAAGRAATVSYCTACQS